MQKKEGTRKLYVVIVGLFTLCMNFMTELQLVYTAEQTQGTFSSVPLRFKWCISLSLSFCLSLSLIHSLSSSLAPSFSLLHFIYFSLILGILEYSANTGTVFEPVEWLRLIAGGL